MAEQSIVTKHLDTYIVESMERERDLRPLLLFNGRATEHRARTVFAFMRLFRDNDIPLLATASSLLASIPDERHRSGLHAKTMVPFSISRWLARMIQSPSVFDIDTNLKGYVEYLWNSLPFKLRFFVNPISETAFRSRRAWRIVEKQLGAPTELYPFVTRDRAIQDPLLSAVHLAVPKYLPEDIRADVCQDLVVSLLTGEISIDSLDAAVHKHVGTHRHMYGDRWANLVDGSGRWIKAVSLSAPAGGMDGFLTVGDTLKD